MKLFIAVLFATAASSSFAAHPSYTCHLGKKSDSGFPSVVKLGVVDNDRIVLIDPDQGKAFRTIRDPHFHSARHPDAVLFPLGGYNPDEDGGDCAALVQGALLTGGNRLNSGAVGGFLTLQCRGEAFFMSNYLCILNSSR